MGEAKILIIPEEEIETVFVAACGESGLITVKVTTCDLL